MPYLNRGPINHREEGRASQAVAQLLVGQSHRSSLAQHRWPSPALKKNVKAEEGEREAQCEVRKRRQADPWESRQRDGSVVASRVPQVCRWLSHFFLCRECRSVLFATTKQKRKTRHCGECVSSFSCFLCPHKWPICTGQEGEVGPTKATLAAKHVMSDCGCEMQAVPEEHSSR